MILPDSNNQKSPRWHLPLLLALACFILLPNLGSSGLAATEGHRTIPAWELLNNIQNHNNPSLLTPTLFHQTYLRKPPAITWAIALSSAILGPTEFAARLVSVLAFTTSVFISYFVAARWFSRKFAIYAGFGHLLTPWFWASARSAEIEPLNNLATQIATLSLLSLLLLTNTSLLKRSTTALICALSLIFLILAKGPAGVPVALATLPAACLVLHSTKPLKQPLLWLALTFTVAIITLLSILTAHQLNITNDTPITQSPINFFWSLKNAWRALLLIPSAWLAALPMSLALLFFTSPDAKKERLSTSTPNLHTLAYALFYTVAISLIIFSALGISNHRYAMPSLAVAPPLLAYLALGIHSFLTPSRLKIARTMLLNKPWLWPVLLTLSAIIYLLILEPSRTRNSGKDAGIALAADLPDNATIWADHLIEARPEVLYYAKQAKQSHSSDLDVYWKSATLNPPTAPPPGTILVLRTDSTSDEFAQYSKLNITLEPIHSGHVHKYDFSAYRVIP